MLEELKNCIIDGPDKRKKFVLSENKAKYTALNKSEHLCFTFQIDNGYIKDGNIKKCDKGLYVDDDRMYLVELKGVDFHTSCQQLLETYRIMKMRFPNLNYKCRAVVGRICSKNNYPASYRILKNALPKVADSFIYKSVQMEELI